MLYSTAPSRSSALRCARSSVQIELFDHGYLVGARVWVPWRCAVLWRSLEFMGWLSRLFSTESTRDPGQCERRDNVYPDCTTDSTELPDPLPNGYRIGPYIIESELPSAGMGRMYRALHPLLHRTVALNVLAVELRADDPRFTGLGADAARKGHPVYDVGFWLGVPFVVVGYSEVHGALVDVSMPLVDVSEPNSEFVSMDASSPARRYRHLHRFRRLRRPRQ